MEIVRTPGSDREQALRCHRADAQAQQRVRADDAGGRSEDHLRIPVWMRPQEDIMVGTEQTVDLARPENENHAPERPRQAALFPLYAESDGVRAQGVRQLVRRDVAQMLAGARRKQREHTRTNPRSRPKIAAA